jgi:hypothetical protein
MNDKPRLDCEHHSEPWEQAQEPVISFVCVDDAGEEEIWSFPFSHLTVGKCKGEMVSLQWGKTLVVVEGPKAREFHREFVKGKATWLKADGIGILSVEVRVKEEKPE